MSLLETEAFETRAAQLTAMVMLVDEEQRPISGDPTPGALLARCLYDLAQAAAQLGRAEALWLEPDEEDRDDSLSLLQVAVQFCWLSVSALTAAARTHPDTYGHEPAWIKSVLLEGLDEEVARWVEEAEYEDLEPQYWLHAVTALFIDAAEGVAQLESCSPRPPPDWHPGDNDAESNERDDEEIAENVADGLGQVASMAATAAQWFEARHYRTNE